jgi:hypothetical protein
MAETPRFNSAQSPRLGQRLPNETSSVRIFNGEEIPPEAWRGMSIFREDTQELLIFTDPGWVAVVGGQRNQKTFIQDAQPDTVDDFVNVGDHWLETDVTPKVWRIFNEEGVWEPLIPTLDELGPVSGKVLQTSLDANRGVKITSAGITGYDSTVGSPTLGDAKFTLSADTGVIVSIGGVIATGESGQRVLITGDDPFGGYVRFFSGHPDEEDPGYIVSNDILSGGHTKGYLEIQAPTFGGAYAAGITLSSLNEDGTGDTEIGFNANEIVFTGQQFNIILGSDLDANGFDLNNVGNIKSGNSTITGFGGADTNTKSINFASSFSGTPTVIVTLFGAAASPGQWSPPVVFNRSSTGFDVKVKRLAGTDTTVDFEWIATQA